MQWIVYSAVALYVLTGVGVAVYSIGLGRGVGEQIRWRREALGAAVAVAFWPFVIIYARGEARGRSARKQT